MKANELRVGNLVTLPYEKDKVHVVRGIDIQFLQEGMDENAMMPIPISERWLKHFKIDEIIKNVEGLNLAICFRAFPIGHWKDGSITIYINDFVKIHVKYVHELQNLHFTLTGQDL